MRALIIVPTYNEIENLRALSEAVLGITPKDVDLLIVDDEANTLASLARAFRLAGHETTVCDNAGKAAAHQSRARIRCRAQSSGMGRGNAPVR